MIDSVQSLASEPSALVRIVSFGAELADTSRTWRAARLASADRLQLLPGCPLQVALGAVAARRSRLVLLLAGPGCRELDGDAALGQLSAVLRGRCPPGLEGIGLEGPKGELPLLRPEDTRLRQLCLAGLPGFGRPGRRVMQRLGLQSWAFPATTVERGTVLVSRPMLQGLAYQPQMHRAIILVLQHGRDGTVAVIVNKPSQLVLRDLGLESAPWSPQLDDSRIFFGGDVGSELCLIHGEPDIGGEDIIDRVFITSSLSDFGRARSFSRQGTVQATSFLWVQGTCCWEPGELEHDMKEKHFSAIHCDRRFLIPGDVSDRQNAHTSDDHWAELLRLTAP